MKFCKYCGKQLEDNETCACQIQNTPVNDSPYAVESSAKQSEFGKKIGAAFKNLPTSFISYWKSPDNIADIAVKQKDFMLSTIYSGIFFIATLLYNVFYILSLQSSGFGSLKIFNFGKVLLTSLVMTILIGGLYVLAGALMNLILCKKDAKSAFSNAFITFAIKSIPVSILFVLAGIFSFLSVYILYAFVIIAVTYLIICFCSEMFVLLGSITKSTKTMLIVCLTVAIVLSVCLYVANELLDWNSQISAASSMSSMTDSVSDFYSSLY